LLPSDDLALVVDQNEQHLIDLALQTQFVAAAIDLLPLAIHVKGPKADVARRRGDLLERVGVHERVHGGYEIRSHTHALSKGRRRRHKIVLNKEYERETTIVSPKKPDLLELNQKKPKSTQDGNCLEKTVEDGGAARPDS
jgi:hypothetical protein